MPAPPSPTPLPTRRRARGALLAAALVTALLALGGCGGSSHPDGTEADPAGAVPADAVLYLGATVRPSGTLQKNAEAVGSKLAGRADPFVELTTLLQTPGSAKLDYKQDIAPWLGPHAGLFVPSLAKSEEAIGPLLKGLTSSGHLQVPTGWASTLGGAIVMDTSDAAAARSFLAGQAKRAGAHAKSYRGVSYEVGSGTAFALVGRFAVIGSETGVREVIDVTQGEPSLASGDGYKSLSAQSPAETLAHVYLVPPKHSLATAAAGAQGAVTGLLGEAERANISLVPAASSVGVYIDTLGPEGGLLGEGPKAAEALESLPGESWLALGIADAGANLPADVGGLKALAGLLGAEASGSGLSLGSIVGGLVKPLSVLGAPTAAARRAYRSWMGSGGIFGGGSSVFELKAGVVISSNDAARSRAAVAKLGAALRASGEEVNRVAINGTEAAIETRLQGLPLPLDIVAGPGAGGPKFVIGLGEASVQAALLPAQTLASSSARHDAASALGEGIEPSLIVEVPTLLSLLESVGLTEDPTLKPVLPFLRAATSVAGGGHKTSAASEVHRFKLVIGLKG